MCAPMTKKFGDSISVQTNVNYGNSVFIEMNTPAASVDEKWSEKDYAFARISIEDARALRDHLNKLFEDRALQADKDVDDLVTHNVNLSDENWTLQGKLEALESKQLQSA